jgi:hypothetical protein
MCRQCSQSTHHFRHHYTSEKISEDHRRARLTDANPAAQKISGANNTADAKTGEAHGSNSMRLVVPTGFGRMTDHTVPG